MTDTRSMEERIAELEKKIDEIKARKQAILKRKKEVERKARTRRLIKIGATIEHYAGEIKDFEALQKYLAQHGDAIARTQNQTPTSSRKRPSQDQPGEL